MEMVSMGTTLPLIPCPYLAQILWTKYGTRFRSESPWDGNSSPYLVRRRLGRTQLCGGLWHAFVVLKRALVSSWWLMCRPWRQTCL